MERHHEMPTGDLWNKSEQERKMPGIWGHTAREFSFCVLPLFPTHTEDRDHVPAALRPRSLVTRAGAAAWETNEGVTAAHPAPGHGHRAAPPCGCLPSVPTVTIPPPSQQSEKR